MLKRQKCWNKHSCNVISATNYKVCYVLSNFHKILLTSYTTSFVENKYLYVKLVCNTSISCIDILWTFKSMFLSIDVMCFTLMKLFGFKHLQPITLVSIGKQICKLQTNTADKNKRTIRKHAKRISLEPQQWKHH